MENVLDFVTRRDFRKWLERNHETAKECYVYVVRSKPDKNSNDLYYIDAVEEALCFGWIDSTVKKSNGKAYQRFSPRRTGSLWTELNKERVRRLQKLGLMTEAGEALLPDMNEEFIIDDTVKKDIEEAGVMEKFEAFHPLYIRVRAYNLNFYRTCLPEQYNKVFANFVKQTNQGKMYGNWNDYGRLLDY